MFHQQVKMKFQAERNDEIKFDKDIRKIKSFFSFPGSNFIIERVKSTIFSHSVRPLI